VVGRTGRLLLVLGVQPGRGYLFARRGGGGTADGSKSPSRLGAVVHSRLIPSPPPNSSRPPVVLSPHRPHALGVGGSVFNISLFIYL
jgi:hypothetical protein